MSSHKQIPIPPTRVSTRDKISLAAGFVAIFDVGRGST
jgi:hypothetical protein